MVKYKYDLFGNLIDISGSEASTIGKYNHFRFKGYYFDEESNMYYCKSRYYVPEWGRWLNLDSPSFLDATSVTRLNLFAYCENNSVTNVDYNGNFGIIASWLIGIAISIVVSLVNEVIEDVSTDGKLGGDKSWKDYTGAAIGGAGIGVGTSALAGGIGNVVDGLITGEVDSVEDTVLQFGVGAATSAVGDLISGGISNKIANKRISPILSGKNNKINKRLSKLPISKKAKKRLGKVGVVGHKTMYKNLYRELHYEELESLISGGFSILISPLF